MAHLKICLLGSFRVSFGESEITNFESNKVRALLAYLAVESDQAHRREKLAAMFWPEMPARRANANLSRALYNLRQLIQDYQAESAYILRRRDAVQFNPQSDYELDASVIAEQLDPRRLRGRSRHEMDARVLEDLEAAVDLYQGDFLEGLAFDSSLVFDEWVMVSRQRFQRQVLGGLHLLVNACAERGEITRALPFAWRQIELDPLGEGAYRQLMRLLAANGQRSQALAQFQRLQVLLSEELNVTPEPQTLALYDQIRGEDQAPVQVMPKHDNLPSFLTPLIGRKLELNEIQAQCLNPDCRILTILGPGGSGKTRLALEAAWTNRACFQNGVCFVPLNPVQSADSILPAIAAALDLPRGEGEDHQTQLINYLRNKDLLLMLDGFEHLLEGAGRVAEILHQAPGFKVLVTSRSRLNIKGEHLYLLAGMRCPQQLDSPTEILDLDCVQLLLAALQRTRPGYQPSTADLPYLLQICRQVRGMPLGILLAASWGATLSIREIAERVSRTLDFLAADWADVPARQRSLRATFDDTWKLLNKRQQEIFQSLSVFRGDFTRRAARLVSRATPHELRDLVERSLLWSKTPGWYEVHELLRQYGREKLSQSIQLEERVCRRHSTHYLEQLARLEEDLKSDRQPAAMSSLDLEHENYRAAWNWAASQGLAEQLDQSLDALCLYYDLSLRCQDGENACVAAMDGLQERGTGSNAWLLRARIFTWQSRFTRLLGQPARAFHLIDKAHRHLEKARAIGDQVRSVEARLALEQGNAHFHNDRVVAASYYQRCLKIYRNMADTWGAARALARLGKIAHHAGNFQEAVQTYTECLALYRQHGDPRGIANALIESGHNTLRQGLVKEGQTYIEEGIIILQQIGDRAGTARGLMELGRSCFWAGQFSKGNSLLAKSCPILEDLGMREQLAFSTIALSLGLSHQGKYKTAINQAAIGLPLAREMDARREMALTKLLIAKAYLGQGDLEQTQDWASKSIAQFQEINQTDELAWALALMVFSLRGSGERKFAEKYLNQTLEVGIKAYGYYPVLCGVYGAALLDLDRGYVGWAVELAALAWRFPVVSKSRWFDDIAGHEIAAQAESLPPELLAAAQERGRKRDLWETAAELLGKFSVPLS